MEATILQFFESIRNPFLTAFFSVFSLLGEATVVGGLAVLVFWLAPRRAGEQIILTALASFPLNSAVKCLVARPRPFVAGVVPYEKPLFAADLEPYASFPSGHTQSSSTFLFPAADVCGAKRSGRRKIALFAAAAVLMLLVMTARLYFGAHYPSDVLAGLALGLVVALLWGAVFRFIPEWRYVAALGVAAVAVLFCPFALSHDYLQATGLVSGAAIALAVGTLVLRERKTKLTRRLLRIPVGVAVAAVAFAATLLFPEGAAFTLLKWFLLAFAAGLVCPLAFDLLGI